MRESSNRPVRQRALIVDDTPAIHDDYRRILDPALTSTDTLDDLGSALFGSDGATKPVEKTRFEVDSAFQGEQGIEMVARAHAEERPYSIAFVDVRMPPGLDGIETLARIWRIDRRIQAVICTAHSDHRWEDIVRALRHSDGFLVLRKPFDPIEVLQMAHALGHKWELSREVERHIAGLERMIYLATHDGLTGLPNRVLLGDRLEHAMARARRSAKRFAVMLVDLDRFKQINDTYGHAAGDDLLKVVGGRLSACVRSCDTVARLGGDEFVILLEELASPDGAAVVAERVVEACRPPIEVAGARVTTPASIGIAMFPDDCEDAATLLESADVAMYQAKSAGRGSFQFFGGRRKVA